VTTARAGAAEAKRSLAPIYPIENAITIDGNVTDREWAPTLGIGKFAHAISIPEYGVVARFLARYDTQYLYVAFRVTDSSPALNKRLQQDRWQGDQVELLLCTDPKGHRGHSAFTRYDYQFFIGPTREGNVDVFVNINAEKRAYVVPGSQAALHVWRDKKGYDVEARIPWASLSRPDYFRPQAGVELGWQIQIDLSTPDGGRFAYAAKWQPHGIHFQHPSSWGWARFMARGETLFAREPRQPQRKPAGKADLSFALRASGLVSINVLNSDGVVVGRPVIAQKMKRGRHTATWDGLDERGEPVEPGTYRFVGLVANLGVKYLATVGNTSPEPYGGLRRSEGGEYRHGAWHDLVMNPDETFYVLNNGGEGPPSIELIDPSKDYRVAWGGTTATAGNEFQQVGARDDHHLYFVHGYAFRKEGRWFSGHMLSRMDVRTHESVRFANGEWVTRLTEPKEGRGWDEMQWEVRGLGAYRGKAFVPMFRANRVDVFDGAKGEKTGSFRHPTLSGPSDVCVTEDGVAFVVDKQSVHRFDLSGKHLDTPVRGLTHGWSVAVDGKGRIYVSDIAQHQVKVFAPSGRRLRTLGRPDSVVKALLWWSGSGDERDAYWGGSGEGSFFHPEGIAVDTQGNLVVADPANATVQCFDPRQRFRKSLIAQIYSSLCVDPQRPETVYLASEGPPMVRQYTIDWRTGRHRLLAQWTPVPKAANGTQFVRFRRRQPFFFSSGGTTVWTIEKGRVRVCSMLGQATWQAAIWVYENGKIEKRFVHEILKLPGPAWDVGHYEWRDRNGNGLPELDEYRIYSKQETKPFWRTASPHNYYVDADWNIQNKVDEGPEGRYIQIPFGGFDKAGNPIYSWQNARLVFQGSKVDPAWTSDLSGGKPLKPSLGGIHFAEGEGVFLVLNDRPEFNPRDCRFRAYTPSGKRLFSLGRGTKGFWDKPGVEISFCMQMTAPIGDFVFVTDTPGAVHVFTREGLYAGTLCEAGDRAPELKGKDPRCQPMGEMWYAHLFRHPRTKRVYLIAQPNAQPLVLLYEVTGLEQVERFEGKCALSRL